MKWNIVLLIILVPLFASAQNKETIDSLAKSKLAELRESWSLGISDSADMDIDVYNQFKSLFDTSATIDDDLNVFYEYAGFKKPGAYKAGGKPEPFDIYAHDVALAVQIKSIPTDPAKTDSIYSDSKDPNKRIFRVSREVNFQKTGNYVIPDSYADKVIKSRNPESKDDLLRQASNLAKEIKKSEDSVYRFTCKEVWQVTMSFNAETSAVVITAINTISSEITCTNDADRDAVPDNEDSFPKTPGDFTANGKPDYDLDGIADMNDKCSSTYGIVPNKGCPVGYFYTKSSFDVFLGGQFNSANINTPTLNQLGYINPSGQGNATDVLQSKKGALHNPGQIGGFYAGGNFSWYFGKRKKQSGISVGLTYAAFTAAYSMDTANPMIYVFKSNDGTNDYRRQIRFNSLTEDISYNVFNLPVMFTYRWHFGGKNNTVIKLQAGPSLMLFRNTSNYTAKIDFGGIYQVDTLHGRNAIVYYDYFNAASVYNVYITSDKLNTQLDSNAANDVFQQLKSAGGYDFADNKLYSGYQHLKKRTAVAFNFGFDLQQKISEGLTLKTGATFVYAPLLDRKEKYKPLDSTSDTFQSVYYANAKSYYSTFGISIGFVYNW